VVENSTVVAYAHAGAPLLGLLVNAVVQIAWFRGAGGRGLLRSVFAGFGCGLIAVGATELAWAVAERAWWESLGNLAVSGLTYAALGYCYFHFINLGETARRIRILRELWDSQGGMTMDELLQKYDAGQILDARIGRMIRNRQIVERGGRYHIAKPTLLCMARTLVTMKVVLLGRRGEVR
jgi:hypothetical protein